MDRLMFPVPAATSTYHEDLTQVKPRRRRRHVPHSERPVDAVRRRNERERKRVNDVNSAFVDLELHLPSSGRSKRRRLSKISILQTAIDYIEQLTSTLNLNVYSRNDPSPTKPNQTFCWVDDGHASSAESGVSGLSGESFDGEFEFLHHCQTTSSLHTPGWCPSYLRHPTDRWYQL